MPAVEPVAAAANEEAIEAWNGVLFDRFVQFRDIVVTGLRAHGEEALRFHAPEVGDRVLDLGCGFGDTTQRLAGLAGPTGAAVGIDAAERFVEAAREEAEAAGAANVSFMIGDVQQVEFDERFDFAFSRMGTMFFANPVAALRNVRRALRPGGRLCMVVWRAKIENEWMYRAEQVVEQFVEEEEDSDEPTCGPGPFSMANADTTSSVLVNAGFEEISLQRCDLPYRIGKDVEQAVALVMALGPAGEVLRLAGQEAVRLAPKIQAALAEEISEFVTPNGVVAPSSSWIVAAKVPAEADG
jgi:ubiquinone/menaquinone biosynthesis C-methylase UbiE